MKNVPLSGIFQRTKRATPNNAKRRARFLPALRFFRLPRKDLRQVARKPGALCIEIDFKDTERDHPGTSRGPEILK